MSRMGGELPEINIPTSTKSKEIISNINAGFSISF